MCQTHSVIFIAGAIGTVLYDSVVGVVVKCTFVAGNRVAVSYLPYLGARTLLGAPGLTTRNKDVISSSWHDY